MARNETVYVQNDGGLWVAAVLFAALLSGLGCWALRGHFDGASESMRDSARNINALQARVLELEQYNR